MNTKKKTIAYSTVLSSLRVDKFVQYFQCDKCDIIIATHFIEHLSNEHFVELAKYCKGVEYIYFEAPLSDDGEDWNGYLGTHKLNFGWNQIVEVMAQNNFEVVHNLNQGKIFKTIE